MNNSAAAMSGTFRLATTLDDLWEGEAIEVEVDGHEIVLIHQRGGNIVAYQGICPHQNIPLVEGHFADGRLVCRAHLWTFDLSTGEGINPTDCRLSRYPVEVRGDEVWISTAGVTPVHAIG